MVYPIEADVLIEAHKQVLKGSDYEVDEQYEAFVRAVLGYLNMVYLIAHNRKVIAGSTINFCIPILEELHKCAKSSYRQGLIDAGLIRGEGNGWKKEN